jgi:hypothetical protein
MEAPVRVSPCYPAETPMTPADFLVALVRRALHLAEKLRHVGILRVERGEPAQVAMASIVCPFWLLRVTRAANVSISNGCRPRLATSRSRALAVWRKSLSPEAYVKTNRAFP